MGMDRYKQFLRSQAVVYVDGSPPPVTNDLLINFIAYCYHFLKLKYQTIKLYLCGIRFFYIRHGKDSPLESKLTNAKVYTFLNSVKRLQNKEKRERLPIDIVLLKKIVQKLKEGCFGLYEDILMSCCCSVAFFAFLRCGEFTVNEKAPINYSTLRLEDIKVNEEFIILHLNQSKSDPFRKGIEIFVYATHNQVCPVAALKKYLKYRGHSNSDALFIMQNGSPLTRTKFISNLKHVLRSIGMDDSKYNGHSFRIGAATTCAKLRIEDHLIKTLGRWSSDCYTTYIHTDKTTIQHAQKAMSNLY
ncbi:uncharacterized protein LOC127876350 [Dreissena polymorpha]|uniref:uncharacterized protein LOC127876350 n=1 Tax=Dreissena polymorpha TaxID=45954 RepID=UPI002264C3B8|nr:uncharacterized protein LOC127876350 [Dreissena polymorpha]